MKDRKTNKLLRAGAAGLALSLAGGPALLSGPRADAQGKGNASASAGAGQPYRVGNTEILADDLSYDFDKRQYNLNGNVEVTSDQSRLTSDEITVQITTKKELEWAKCRGNVFVEKKNPEDGTSMTGRGRTLDYYEVEQKANLQGDVVVNQTSPRLAKPAVITGARVDMDLKTQQNVVFRAANAQAKVHIEPKGGEPKPAPANGAAVRPVAAQGAGGSAAGTEAPEPIDLLGDRIEMNGATQEYQATGNPAMVRPSSRLQGRKIRFTVESASNDVKTAYADDDVVFDAQGQGGSIIHATGDNAVYNRDQKEVVLTGNVHATTKDPDDEAPTVYQGHQFIYNTLTRSYRLRRDPSKGPQATVVLPPSKTQQRPEVVKPRGSEERETPKKPEEKGGGTGSEEKK